MSYKGREDVISSRSIPDRLDQDHEDNAENSPLLRR